jgi:hypothetical protein
MGLGAQLRQTTSDVVRSHSVLVFWASQQLDVQRLWDPGRSSCRPAWGQADFQGGGNVTDWTLRWAVMQAGPVHGPREA